MDGSEVASTRLKTLVAVELLVKVVSRSVSMMYPNGLVAMLTVTVIGDTVSVMVTVNAPPTSRHADLS